MKRSLIIFFTACVFVAAMTWMMLKQGEVQCALCVNFNGKQQCSEALGPSESAAIDEAHRNACSLLGSGVTESVACHRTPPNDVHCSNGGHF